MMTFCFIIPLNQNYKFIICRICDGRLKKVWPAFPLQQSNLLLPPILYFTIFVLLLLLIIYSTTVNSTFLLHLIYSIIGFIISIIYCILLQIIQSNAMLMCHIYVVATLNQSLLFGISILYYRTSHQSITIPHPLLPIVSFYQVYLYISQLYDNLWLQETLVVRKQYSL